MSYQYDGDDDALRDWIDLIERRTNRPSEYYHHPPKPWLREEALKAAVAAAYAAHRAELARINEEYPQ